MKYINEEELNNIEDVIKSTIEQSKYVSSGGRGLKANTVVWTPPLVDMRNRWVITQVVKKGKSFNEVRAYMRDNWSVSHSTSEKYMKEALGSLAEMDEDNKRVALAVHRERLEDLYARAVEHNKIDSALRVLEQMAKVNGYYNDTMVVNMPVMQFKFGDEDNLIHISKNGGQNIDGLQTI